MFETLQITKEKKKNIEAIGFFIVCSKAQKERKGKHCCINGHVLRKNAGNLSSQKN